MTKILVSLSDDVIFNPGTQTTRYSLERAIKNNLKRRMPEFQISVGRMLADDDHSFVQVGLSADLEIDGVSVFISAECAASSSDLMLREVQGSVGDNQLFNIAPAHHPRNPEAADKFLRQLASNFVRQAIE